MRQVTIGQDSGGKEIKTWIDFGAITPIKYKEATGEDILQSGQDLQNGEVGLSTMTPLLWSCVQTAGLRGADVLQAPYEQWLAEAPDNIYAYIPDWGKSVSELLADAFTKRAKSTPSKKSTKAPTK